MNYPALPEPGTETAEALVARLGNRFEDTLREVVGEDLSRPYVLLDHPDYANVGDSAIYLGEVLALERIFGRPPVYVCKFSTDWEEIRASIPDDAVIFLHGGGNFGDIWERHQDFREKIFQQFSQHRLIHLPQSIHYGNAERIAQTAKAIAGARRLTLLLRDEPSMALAAEHFDCDLRLCPDAAFAIGTLPRPAPPQVDLLLMLRDDKESTGPGFDASRLSPRFAASYIVDDWGADVSNVHKTATWTARTLALRTGRLSDLGRPARQVAYYRALAQLRLDHGLAKLARGRFIITDRLHVHILSSLMGIPHAFTDNSYGKIARLSAAFGSCWQGATRATDLDAALAAAEVALARQDAEAGTQAKSA